MYAWWHITGHLNIKCTFTLSAITLLFLWFLEFTTFFFLLNTPAKWTRHIRPAKLTRHFGPAKLTHHSGPAKIDPPLWTRQIDPPLWTCQIDPPIWTRQCTPHSEFPGSPGPADSPPPPPPLRLWWDGEGRGVGGGPGPPEHPKQVLYFTAPLANGLHMHVPHTYTMFLFSIQGGKVILKSVAKYITFRRRKLLQSRWVRGQSSHSRGGILLIVYNNRKSARNPGLTRMRITQ